MPTKRKAPTKRKPAPTAATTLEAPTIHALGDRIVVRRKEKVSASEGGILLPTAGQEKQREGTVLHLGPGRLSEHGKRIPIEIPLGAVVVFSTYAGYETQGDPDLLIMSSEDVLGIRP